MAAWLSEHLGVMPEDCVRIDPEVWAQIAGFIDGAVSTVEGSTILTENQCMSLPEESGTS